MSIIVGQFKKNQQFITVDTIHMQKFISECHWVEEKVYNVFIQFNYRCHENKSCNSYFLP